MKHISRTMGPIGLVLSVFALVCALSGGVAVAATVITTSQIKNYAVTNPKIANLAVSNGKIASSAVTGAKVKDGTLTLNDLAPSERAKILNVPVNTTVVEGPTVTVLAGDIGSVMAVCPAGMKTTGGGYFSSIAIAASSTPFQSSWGVVINNTGNPINVDVNAYVVCV